MNYSLLENLISDIENAELRSCKKCVPGREGIRLLLEYLKKFRTGPCSELELENLSLIAKTISKTSGCVICSVPAAALLHAVGELFDNGNPDQVIKEFT